jgi:hypothetical protein
MTAGRGERPRRNHYIGEYTNFSWSRQSIVRQVEAFDPGPLVGLMADGIEYGFIGRLQGRKYDLCGCQRPL